MEKRYFEKDKEGLKDCQTQDFDINYSILEDKKVIKKTYCYNETYLSSLIPSVKASLIEKMTYAYNKENILESCEIIYVNGDVLFQTFKYSESREEYKYIKRDMNDNIIELGSYDEDIHKNIKIIRSMLHDIRTDKITNSKNVIIYKDETLKEELYNINHYTKGDKDMKDSLDVRSNYKCNETN